MPEECASCKTTVLVSRPGSDSNGLVEAAKKRCISVRARIQALPVFRVNDSCKRTLLKLVDSEFRFLSRPTLLLGSDRPSLNIGYIESLVFILDLPFVNGVSRICKRIPVSLPHGKKRHPCSTGIHVDIVCTVDNNAVWFIVSDRNPKYITWSDSHRNKGLHTRVVQVLKAARSELSLRPSSVIFFFSNGLDDNVSQKLRDEFGAFDPRAKLPHVFSGLVEVDDDWVYLDARYKASVFQINVESTEKGMTDISLRDSITAFANFDMYKEQRELLSSDVFGSLLSTMQSISESDVDSDLVMGLDENLINLDTTALVALVSGISNGSAEKLSTAPENEVRRRFKNNIEFIMTQVKSELEFPIIEALRTVLSGKRGIICKTVYSEFKELISMYAGSKEKSRADELFNHLTIIPDDPSTRFMSLPTTRKIAMKNKIIFGTGDKWRAPTLTANMGFVRAVLQTGMSLFTMEHRPRALIGD